MIRFAPIGILSVSREMLSACSTAIYHSRTCSSAEGALMFPEHSEPAQSRPETQVQ